MLWFKRYGTQISSFYVNRVLLHVEFFNLISVKPVCSVPLLSFRKITFFSMNLLYIYFMLANFLCLVLIFVWPIGSSQGY